MPGARADVEVTGRKEGKAPRWRLVVKLVVSVGLLAFVVHRVGPGAIGAQLEDARLGFVVIVLALMASDTVLRSYNWKQLLDVRGETTPFGQLFSIFVAASFFGSFVPSTLGVDAARAWVLSRRREMKFEEAASSVVMLNLVGLWALAVTLVLGAAGLAVVAEVPGWLAAIAAVAASGAVALLLLLRSERPVPLAEHGGAVVRRLARFGRAMARYRAVRRRLPPVFAVAGLNQLIAVLVFWSAFRALGGALHPWYFLALVPAITLARVIPASIAGFGAEQAVVVAVFGLIGVEPSRSVTMSLLVSTLNVVVTGFYGLFYVGEKAGELVDMDVGAAPGRGDDCP